MTAKKNAVELIQDLQSLVNEQENIIAQQAEDNRSLRNQLEELTKLLGDQQEANKKAMEEVYAKLALLEGDNKLLRTQVHGMAKLCGNNQQSTWSSKYGKI